MSQTITITVTAVDAAGATGSATVDVTLSSFTLAASVNPANAPAGTTRTLTASPTGGTAPFSFGNPVGEGLTFTPVDGSPGQWTFVL